MSILSTFTVTKEDLEDAADLIKITVVEALVNDGYLTIEEGDAWCENTTIIMRKKGIFRTLTNLWKNKEETKDGFYYLVVSMDRAKKEVNLLNESAKH
jgi:hypothetical protein